MRSWINATAAAALAAAAVGQALTAEDLARRPIERRAVEAAVWGMPLVAFDAMRQAFLRDAGAKYGDIAFCSKPADWRLRVTTPNATSLYVYLNYNLKAGPWVLEVPPAAGAGLFGSLNDAWQVPLADVGPEGEDKGRGGRYLILPPGFKGNPPEGHIPVRSNTFNGYSILRAIPKTRSEEDTAKALALVKKLRLYPLSQAAEPPKQRFIDISSTVFDGIASMDDSYYDSLARMVEEEPIQLRDLAVMGQLRSLGIEKGKLFDPDTETRTLLMRAAEEAHATLMAGVEEVKPYATGSRWGLPGPRVAFETSFTFQGASFLDLDARARVFYLGCAPPKRPGAASFYLLGTKDEAGSGLDGGRTYHLRVPPGVPARQFWAVTVYDLSTAAFFREAPKVEVSSTQRLQGDTDGSVSVQFGPQAPAGRESNWVYTAPGRRWLALFRLYGPEKAVFDKTWILPDIQADAVN